MPLLAISPQPNNLEMVMLASKCIPSLFFLQLSYFAYTTLYIPVSFLFTTHSFSFFFSTFFSSNYVTGTLVIRITLTPHKTVDADWSVKKVYEKLCVMTSPWQP